MNQVLTLATALLTAVLLTPAVRALAFRFNLLDIPDYRKIHSDPKPLLGGLAIYLGFAVGLMVSWLSFDGEAWNQLGALLASSTFLVLVGLLDDRFSIHPRIKLFAAIPFAGLILAVGGIRITVWPLSPLLSSSPLLAIVFGTALTILWVVVITSAFSILDHMDGLCAGTAAITSFFFLIFASLEGQIMAGVLCAAMIGANLGFLKWNLRSATIFMGDNGALFVGLTMSALGIIVKFMEVPTATSWMIPIMVLGLPLFDALLVVVSRFRRGLSPSSSPGKDHTAHRLANLGLGETGAVLVLYGASIVLGLAALLLMQLSPLQSYVVGGTLAVLAMLLIVLLEKAPFEKQEKIQTGASRQADAAP